MQTKQTTPAMYWTALVIVLLLVVGWCINAIKVFTGIPPTFNELPPIYVLRVIGLFVPPLGGVVGWL